MGKKIVSTLVILVAKKGKKIQSKCQKYFKRHDDLILIGKEGKKIYDLIKDFNTFIYDYTLHRGRKQSCSYFLQVFSTEEVLKIHVKN